MKIIFTCHTYYPKHDGVQFVTQYLAEGLAKKGHEVLVLTCMPLYDETPIEEKHNGVLIHRFNVVTKHTIHTGEKEKYIEYVLKLSKEYDILINVCTQCALTDWLLPYLKNIKIPKFLYLHSIWDFKYKREDFLNLNSFLSKIFSNVRWKLYYKNGKKYFKEYNSIIQLHNMDYTKAFFKKKYNIDSLVIENAAESNFFNDKFDKNINLPNKYLLNVSNYLKRKNQKKALELFLNSNLESDWEFIFIGSHKNEYYNKLVSIYEKYKVKNPAGKKVSFLYNIPREQIYTYVKRASIYMMTSKWEAFPISLTESMAAGIPFISSDVGIVKYLSGGVVCKNDRDYIFWLDNFSKNNDLRLEYGNLGKIEACNRFSVEKKVDQLEKILFEYIER